MMYDIILCIIIIVYCVGVAGVIYCIVGYDAGIVVYCVISYDMDKYYMLLLVLMFIILY